MRYPVWPFTTGPWALKRKSLVACAEAVRAGNCRKVQWRLAAIFRDEYSIAFGKENDIRKGVFLDEDFEKGLFASQARRSGSTMTIVFALLFLFACYFLLQNG